MLRRGFVIIAVILLLIITVVSVWALWRSQPVSVAPAPQVESELIRPEMQTGLQVKLLPRQQALFDRLSRRLQENTQDYEALLLQALLFMQLDRIDDALELLRQLTLMAPKFQLAHLVYGDLLLARFEQIDALGGSQVLAALEPLAEGQQLENLRREAQARIKGYLSLLDGQKIPAAFLALDASIGYALLVDKANNRLYVFENAGVGLPPRLVDDYYVVLGREPGNKYKAGDLKTPSGVYYVTRRIADGDLPIKYGTGAFPVNYPNEFDLHLQKSGHGIWLHGTDKSLYSRPPRDTEGCVALTNTELLRIGRYIEPGKTPVVISAEVEWLSGRQWLEQNIELQATLERWRASWEQVALDKYFNSYADDFWADDYNLAKWKAYKSRVLRQKKSQNISLRDLTLLKYPLQGSEGRTMVVATFFQEYRSNNYNGDMRKKLYMVKEEQRWKILYEGAAEGT
jgi:murein L,D-transpeptidase YafK